MFACSCRCGRRRDRAGIEDVEVEVEQEQEDIEQENEAEQDGAAYATADYSGDVYVEQSGTLTAGDLRSPALAVTASTPRRWPRPRPISIKPRSRATAIAKTSPKTPLHDPGIRVHRGRDIYQCCCLAAGDDAEIDAGIEDVEVSLEQEQEDIDQENEADQDGEAEAEAYSGDVYVEQTGGLFAVEDGVDATSEAEANASLEQKATRTISTPRARPRRSHSTRRRHSGPTTGDASASAVARLRHRAPADGGVALAAGDDVEIDAGIEDVEVSLEQEQEEIEQENEAEQEGEVDASAYSGDVTVNVGLDEVPVDPIAGDTGVDAASEADADADLEQLADQSNINQPELRPRQPASARRRHLTLLRLLRASTTPRSQPGSRTSRLRSSRSRRTSIRANDADQSGEAYAEAYSGYVDVLQRSGDLLTAGGTGIEAESRGRGRGRSRSDGFAEQ